MPNEMFNYENISDKKNKVVYDRELNYEASRGSNFIRFSQIIPTANVVEDASHGWKFQISINDEEDLERVNLALGWNIVKDILINHNVNQAKVTCLDTPMSQHFVDEHAETGKQISIYAYRQPELDWAFILQEIETALETAQVVPTPLPEGNRHIPGSQYLSYRNDADPEGNYTRNPGNYNPYNYDDPYFNIAVQAANPIPPHTNCCKCNLS